MKALYDTCVYINFFNRAQHSELFSDRTYFRFLSPIVVMELRAGARQSREVSALDDVFLNYLHANRLIEVTPKMYFKAGEILAKAKKIDGNLSKGFSNDVLIALCAQSIGATLFTENERDFERIFRFLPFKLRIV